MFGHMMTVAPTGIDIRTYVFGFFKMRLVTLKYAYAAFFAHPLE
jgi:hypothetical protein